MIKHKSPISCNKLQPKRMILRIYGENNDTQHNRWCRSSFVLKKVN